MWNDSHMVVILASLVSIMGKIKSTVSREMDEFIRKPSAKTWIVVDKQL